MCFVFLVLINLIRIKVCLREEGKSNFLDTYVRANSIINQNFQFENKMGTYRGRNFYFVPSPDRRWRRGGTSMRNGISLKIKSDRGLEIGQLRRVKVPLFPGASEQEKKKNLL